MLPNLQKHKILKNVLGAPLFRPARKNINWFEAGNVNQLFRSVTYAVYLLPSKKVTWATKPGSNWVGQGWSNYTVDPVRPCTGRIGSQTLMYLTGSKDPQSCARTFIYKQVLWASKEPRSCARTFIYKQVLWASKEPRSCARTFIYKQVPWALSSFKTQLYL